MTPSIAGTEVVRRPAVASDRTGEVGMVMVGVAVLLVVTNVLVVFALVNLALSFWHRWSRGVPGVEAATDTLLARASRRSA